MLIDDRYRLEEAVGHGGMGEVWRASDTMLGRSVAIKLLSPDPGDEKATTRFTLEARTAGRLSHPNTVAVYDFGTAGDQLYLVMEYVDGHSLAAEAAASGPLDPERVADLGAQAASGLAAAHREGIVHRDIKPANLLLTEDGTLKIGDFGIARFADESASVTGSGAIVGTTPYLAPERARGRASGPPADMYALGCVLYELLTGRPPFRADTPAATLYQHVESVPAGVLELRDDVPAPMAELVGSLLSKDPARRPTAEQVADWLATPAWRTGRIPAPGSTAATAVERPPVAPVVAVAPAVAAASAASAAPAAPAAAQEARGAGPSPEPTTHQAPADPPGSRRRYVLAGVAATVALAATTLGLAALTDDPPTRPAHPPAAAGTPSKPAHGRPAAPGSGPATPSSADVVDAPAGSAPTAPVSTAPGTAGTTATSGSSSAPGTPPSATASPSMSGSGSPTASGSPSPSGSPSASGTRSPSATPSASGPAGGSTGVSASGSSAGSSASSAGSSGTSSGTSSAGSSAPGGYSSAPAGSGSGAPSTTSTAPSAP